MDKNGTVKDYILELQKTKKIEIMQDIDVHLYEQILMKHGKTKDEFTQALLDNGFSEFIIGIIMGVLMQQEKNVELKRGWRSYIPSILHK